MSTMDLLDDFASATVATRNITLVEGKTTLDYYQQLESNKALKSNGSFAKTMQIAGIQAPYEGLFGLILIGSKWVIVSPVSLENPIKP
ncbi:hypothetical protein BSPWISOXPB_6477 [uncultured Gammaproteobacteria bacterium]|nr:hypothetical protein BSPWISOXPB_6477 [uncultured Gammaproteobacteria bacterium]